MLDRDASFPSVPAIGRRTTPLISAIIPVHNGEETVRDAVNSTLQDGEAGLEVLVINDGSKDGTADALRQIRDPRVTVVDLPSNKGLPHALNVGLEAARGRFIARMDADDISLPGRFRAQLRSFSAKPSLVLCGTNVRICDGEELSDSDMHQCPTDPEDIRQELWFRTPILHPTVMFDRTRIPDFSLHYLESLKIRQDQELFLRLLEYGDARNLAGTYVVYRRHASAATISKAYLHREARAVVIREALKQRGIICARHELAAHMALCPRLPGEPTGPRPSENDLRHWTARLFKLRERLGIRDGNRWHRHLVKLLNQSLAQSTT